MKSAVLLIPLLLPLPAFAGGSAAPGQPMVSASAMAQVQRQKQRQQQLQQQSLANNVTVNTSQAASPGPGRGSGGGGSRVPDVVAGSIGTSNPCGVGGGLGGSGGGGGGFLQWLVEGERCSLREDARLLWQMGESDSAMQTACNNAWIADGRARAGHPCERDMQRWRDQGYRYVLRSDGKWVWER